MVRGEHPLDQPLTMDIKGRDLVEGVPKTLTLTDEEVREALSEVVAAIFEEESGTGVA